MSDDNSEIRTGTARHSTDVTDPVAIARLLGEVGERQHLLFFSEIGANLAFVAKGAGLDPQRGRLRISVAAGQSVAGATPVGRTFEVFAPVRHADLVFAARVLDAAPDGADVYDVGLPDALRQWRRREHPRGSCFGLVDVVLRRRDSGFGEVQKATLKDISRAGLGVRIAPDMDLSPRAGDLFDECILLLNNKPMAICAVEVLHSRREDETGSLVAGGRFVDLNDVAAARIEKLIAILDPLWSQPAAQGGT